MQTRASEWLRVAAILASVSACTERDPSESDGARGFAELEWRRVGSIPLPIDLRLAPGVGEPVGEGSVVVLTPTRILVGARTVAPLRDGVIDPVHLDDHRVLPLHDALRVEPGSPESTRLLFAIDRATPMSTVIDVLYTGIQAGFDEFGFVVETSGGATAVIPFSGTRTEVIPYEPDEPRIYDEPVKLSLLTIELTDDGFSLASPQRDPEAHGLDELDVVRAFAEQIRSEWPTARIVAVSAAPSVEFGRVLAAVVAARGPACAPPEPRCLLPEVMLGSDGVHGYLPVLRVTRVRPE